MRSPPSAHLAVSESFVQNEVHEAPGVLSGLLKSVELRRLGEHRTAWALDPVLGRKPHCRLCLRYQSRRGAQAEPPWKRRLAPQAGRCRSRQPVDPLPLVGTHPLAARGLLGNPPQLGSLVTTASAVSNTQPSQCIEPFSGYQPF